MFLFVVILMCILSLLFPVFPVAGCGSDGIGHRSVSGKALLCSAPVWTPYSSRSGP